MFDVTCMRYYNLFDDRCFDKTELRFLKSILGVHRKASNAAVRGELGKYPSIIYVIKQVVKNWLRIASYRKDSLLYDTYLCNLQMVFEGKNCWLLKLYNIVSETLGFKHLWENQGLRINGARQIYKIVSNLQHIFEFQWKNEINKRPDPTTGSGSKLRTYSKFKKTFEYEKYLDFKKRKEITKLRISAHRLEVEVGRYRPKKGRVKPEERVCKFCDLGKVEDEMHVVMVCPMYVHQRKAMLDTIFQIFPDIPTHDISKQLHL
jgi:hypothetical protein